MKPSFWILLAPLLLVGCDRPAETVSASSAASSAIVDTGFFSFPDLSPDWNQYT